MFQLFTGRYHALEDELLTHLLEERNRDPLGSLLIVSPSGHILTRLQQELSKRRPGFLNIHFLSFYALAVRLMVGSAYSEPIMTEPTFFHEMVRWILSAESGEAIDQKLRRDFGLEKRALPKGLPGALAATLKDLSDAGVLAETAIQATQEGFLGKHALEAAPTLALYARTIGLFETHGLRTSADLFRRAATLALDHSWVKEQKGIFLYGFYDLTGVQLDLLLALSSHSKARVYFPYDAGNTAYAFAEKLLNDPAFTSKVGTKVVVGGTWNVVRKIELSSRTTDHVPMTTVWSVSGSRDEIWLAAKEILRLNAQGLAFKDIAVISRRMDPYLPALREIFPAHQLPYDINQGEPAGVHPLIKTIRSLVSFEEENPAAATRRQALEKSPYWKMTPQLAPPMSGHEARAPWSAHATRVKDAIQLAIALPADVVAEERSLFEDVLNSLQALHALDVLGSPVTWRQFLAAWEERLDALRRPLPPSHAGVQVLEVLQARGLRFKAVFVLGLNEKTFPRLIREDPFLLDQARAALSQTLGSRLPLKLEGYSDERLLFTLMQETAEESLTLITQRSDDEGKTLIPSIYLQEYLRETRQKAKRLPRAFPAKFKTLKLTPNDCTPKEASYLLNRARHAYADLEPLYAALGWDKTHFKALLSAQEDMERFHKGLLPYDGLISAKELIRPALAKGFSPSSMEDLAECPFQYYAGQVLKLIPKEELAPNGEITNKALGSLFHRILEVFYKSLKDLSNPTPIPSSGLKLESALETACQTVFAEFKAKSTPIYPLAWKATESLVRKVLQNFIKQDIEESKESGFFPAYFEETLEGHLPLKGSAGQIWFHGRPDRLDLQKRPDGTRVRVVDYKTGKAKELKGKLETQLIKGKFLQLPIYQALAVDYVKAHGHPQAQAESAALRWLRPEREDTEPPTLQSGFWQSPEAKTLAENLEGLIRLVEQGQFYIEPDSGQWGYCARCSFARVCRKEHMRTRSRSEWEPFRIANRARLDRTAGTKEKRREQ